MNLFMSSTNFIYMIFLITVFKGSKTLPLPKDSRKNPLNYDQDWWRIEFIDFLSYYVFLPHVLQLMRASSNSKALNDNIFSNAVSLNTVSDHFILSVADHLPPISHSP